MLYLVEASIVQSEYMGRTTYFNCIRLVEALSSDDAEVKMKSYWENKSVDYDVSYYANCCKVYEVIT